MQSQDKENFKIHSSLRTVDWKDNNVVMIDQTKLPNELVYVKYNDYHDVADAISTLVVRGAPAIGVSGAFGLALASLQSKATDTKSFLANLEDARKILYATRPTAVNLKWGLNKIMSLIKQSISKNNDVSIDQLRSLAVSEAKKIAENDIMTNISMGKIWFCIIF